VYNIGHKKQMGQRLQLSAESDLPDGALAQAVTELTHDRSQYDTRAEMMDMLRRALASPTTESNA
jgi:hypothetical protein